MKVFKIDTFAAPSGTRFEYYAQLECKKSDERFLDDAHFDGQPFPKKWRRVELHFGEPLWPRADFYNFGLGNFVCTERVKLLIGTVMETSGEFLPVTIEGEEGIHYIYNVTDCGPYIDPLRSVWRCNLDYPDELENPAKALLVAAAFGITKASKRTIFKIPQETAIYCAEKTARASDDEFKALVEHHQLTGLRFQLVWSQSGGPLPMDMPPIKGGRIVWKTGDGKDYRVK